MNEVSCAQKARTVSHFSSDELTIFAYGENRPMGVRYLSVTKARPAD